MENKLEISISCWGICWDSVRLGIWACVEGETYEFVLLLGRDHIGMEKKTLACLSGE